MKDDYPYLKGTRGIDLFTGRKNVDMMLCEECMQKTDCLKLRHVLTIQKVKNWNSSIFYVCSSTAHFHQKLLDRPKAVYGIGLVPMSTIEYLNHLEEGNA